MAFDKKYYREIKKFVKWRLTHRSCLSESTLEEHVLMVMQIMPGLIEREDFEALKAVKDAIIEFINSLPGEKVKKDVLLKIPPYVETEGYSYHLSF